MYGGARYDHVPMPTELTWAIYIGCEAIFFHFTLNFSLSLLTPSLISLVSLIFSDALKPKSRHWRGGRPTQEGGAAPERNKTPFFLKKLNSFPMCFSLLYSILYSKRPDKTIYALDLGKNTRKIIPFCSLNLVSCIAWLLRFGFVHGRFIRFAMLSQSVRLFDDCI